MALAYTKRPPARGMVYESFQSGRAVKPKRNIFIKILSYFIPFKGDSVFEGVRKVIFTGALACFIYFGSTVGADFYSEFKAGQLQDYLGGLVGGDYNPEVREKLEQMRPDAKPLPDYLAVYEKNNDFVGWIRIGDTAVNYPVLQADNNIYYLNNDFERNYSKGGSIFADSRNRFDGLDISDNTVLYGHNIMTGNYFNAASNYYKGAEKGDMSFYKNNPIINFDTLYEKSEWKVFATVLFNTQEQWGEVYRYNTMHDFATADDFNNFIINIMDRSVIHTDVDLQYGDKILTLSTCYWPMGDKVDTRCVVFARKVREGESSYVNVDAAVNNYKYELRFTEQARRYGTLRTERNWDTSKLIGYKEEEQ
ncbi:MAG: class B sortase [Oscillospiraceae bacterium]|nr:class B sortase [Oscillospiraceae bacterium]